MSPDDIRKASLFVLQAACAAFCFWIAWTLLRNPTPPKNP